jgi:protein-disulfide isomerase-like protein with CxxC motif
MSKITAYQIKDMVLDEIHDIQRQHYNERKNITWKEQKNIIEKNITEYEKKNKIKFDVISRDDI